MKHKKESFYTLTKAAAIIGIISIIVVIAAALILNYFFGQCNEWLFFWGASLGGLIGAAVIFIAFLHLSASNNRQHQDTQSTMKELNRISLLPMLTINELLDVPNDNCANIKLRKRDLNINDMDLSETEKNQIQKSVIWIKNIGQAAAVHVKIFFPGESNGLEIGHLNKDDLLKLSIYVPYCRNAFECEFCFTYYDLSGQKYSQKAIMQSTYDHDINVMRINFTPSTYPVLNETPPPM